MNKRIRRGLLRLARSVPKITPLYVAARRYVLNCDGELNCEMTTNGELRVLREQLAGLSRPPVVVDIGANRGEWTAAVLEIAPQASVFCFEPGSGVFARLQARNFPPNVKLFNMAVGAEPAQLKLNVYGEVAGMNSLFVIEQDRPRIREELVTVVPLAPFAEEQSLSEIDFVKIDVEGSEFNVLMGAQPLLEARRIKALQFEYGEGWIGARRYLRDVVEWLRKIPGYSLHKITAHRTVPIARYAEDLENFHCSNYLLLRDAN
jgi:FkbM family methyltransferase